MRVAVVAALVLVGWLSGSVLGIPYDGAPAVSTAPVGPNQGLMTIASPPQEGQQMFTVIDSATRAMAVYHVDLKSGQTTLRSVRNLHWDLQLEDFNSVTPKAREVRIQVQGR